MTDYEKTALQLYKWGWPALAKMMGFKDYCETCEVLEHHINNFDCSMYALKNGFTSIG